MKRYDFYSDGFDNCEMRNAEAGEYVTFDDHKKELDMLVESLKELMSIVKIHSDNMDNDFAWAEMSEAHRTIRHLTTAST
jgi:hypothetical protein